MVRVREPGHPLMEPRRPRVTEVGLVRRTGQVSTEHKVLGGFAVLGMGEGMWDWGGDQRLWFM